MPDALDTWVQLLPKSGATLYLPAALAILLSGGELWRIPSVPGRSTPSSE